MKGAPEDILRLSTHTEAADSTKQPITELMRTTLRQQFDAIGADGMRALGVAMRTLDHAGAAVADEADLVFAGFAVFLDSPEASAGPALRALVASGALHAADVGISVDSAADVAKAAAQIVLLKPDLGVLLEGVLEGRRTVRNVEKYILMASSANLGNIVSLVIAGLILPYLPLLPIQLLLTNLMYDCAQLGLPTDRVDPESIARPVYWDIRLIRRFMLVLGPVSTVFYVITFGVLLLVFHAGEELFRTGCFVESLVTQLLMIFAVRTRRHLFASRPQRGVTLLAVGMVALTVALPFTPMGAWFGFVVPPAAYFVFLAAAAFAFLVVIEAIKRLFYSRLLTKPILQTDRVSAVVAS